MYSRIPRQPPRPAGVPSYRQRVTPPPNYSGNAFPAEPDPDDARPRFDGLPTVSTLPARDMLHIAISIWLNGTNRLIDGCIKL